MFTIRISMGFSGLNLKNSNADRTLIVKKKVSKQTNYFSCIYFFVLLLENSALKSTNRLRLASLALLRKSRKKINESRYVAFIEARLLFEGIA